MLTTTLQFTLVEWSMVLLSAGFRLYSLSWKQAYVRRGLTKSVNLHILRVESRRGQCWDKFCLSCNNNIHTGYLISVVESIWPVAMNIG